LGPAHPFNPSGEETVRKIILSTALLAALIVNCLAHADNDREKGKKSHSGHQITLAVMGDWPYGAPLFDASQLLINSVNSDPDVSLILHVGDIHSGSQPCTGAELSPVPAGSAPDYNLAVFQMFEQFTAPFVYTPGDNEWTDCHKTKEFRSGAPLNELASVRKVFFPNPGLTLGVNKKTVASQADKFDRDHPADTQFVENVMWEQKRVVFVTLNMPGSNNDGLTWTNGFTNEPARILEASQRTLANIRWLNAAFERAEEEHAKAVVIGLQADMWDPAALVPGGDGLSNYTLFVQELAALAGRFAKPVLLINGDSHVYGSDTPLADPNSATGKIHNTPAVPNLTRITVQGSTTAPAEWLRLIVDPESAEVFSWTNVTYCGAPATACP
jgi:hypothetical protein